VEYLFTDTSSLQVTSQRIWLSILNKHGPFRLEVDTGCNINPKIDLVGIGEYADALLQQLLCLIVWLATSMRSGRHDDVAMVPADGQLTWARGPGPAERGQD
jgi:hypothetical protein